MLFADIALGLTVIVAILGGVEKLRAVAEGRTTWHPVALAWPLLRRHAKLIFITAGSVDLLLGLVLLQNQSRLALIAWSTALSAYTFVGHRAISVSGTCGCFGSLLEVRNRRLFLVRNVSLLLLCLVLLFSNPRNPVLALFMGSSVVAVLYVGTRLIGGRHGRVRRLIRVDAQQGARNASSPQ